MAGGLTEYLMQKYSLVAEEATGRPAQVDRNRRLVAFAWGELQIADFVSMFHAPVPAVGSLSLLPAPVPSCLLSLFPIPVPCTCP